MNGHAGLVLAFGWCLLAAGLIAVLYGWFAKHPRPVNAPDPVDAHADRAIALFNDHPVIDEAYAAIADYRAGRDITTGAPKEQL